jgi:hypothetical protein
MLHQIHIQPRKNIKMHIPKSQRPYIGITDFMTNLQVEHMLNVFRKHRAEGSLRRLHVGVMMSFKTLYGHETQWTNAFPAKEILGQIFYFVGNPDSLRFKEMNEDLMHTLHYADYQERPDVVKNLTDALAYAGPFVDALQLDMIWPDPDKVKEAIKASGKDIEVILQIGENAMEDAKNDSTEIVERLYFYQDVITHVLLDKSMGKGLGMNAKELLPFARAIRKAYPNLGLVIAGGLGPETMHLAQSIVAEFPDVSIDAQGQLRPSKSALDPIDWDIASQYLIEALSILK